MVGVNNNLFGNVTLASEIEDATIATLQKWFATYLLEMQRKLGIRTPLVSPENYMNRNSNQVVLGEKLPKVVVISPGLEGTPTKAGQHVYRAIWRLGVGVAIASRDERTANMMVKAYGAAVRAILLQKHIEGLHGCRGITWIEENYDDLPITNQTVLYKAANVFFTVDVEDVVSGYGGPDQPIATDPGDWPEVEEVFITLDTEGIT